MNSIRLYITTEGRSEERFVSDILEPHLRNFNINVEARSVLTNQKQNKRGGISNYLQFKNDLNRWFKECPDVHHSCMIDLYGLSAGFPGYLSTKHLQPYSRVAEMERLLAEDLKFPNFIPYIQLHEYEAMLFSDTAQMENWLSLYKPLPINCFAKIRNSATHKNPELINENVHSAPSKKILQLYEDYDKIEDGILILKEIGLNKIRSECRHFNEWLTKLEKLT